MRGDECCSGVRYEYLLQKCNDLFCCIISVHSIVHHLCSVINRIVKFRFVLFLQHLEYDQSILCHLLQRLSTSFCVLTTRPIISLLETEHKSGRLFNNLKIAERRSFHVMHLIIANTIGRRDIRMLENGEISKSLMKQYREIFLWITTLHVCFEARSSLDSQLKDGAHFHSSPHRNSSHSSHSV